MELQFVPEDEVPEVRGQKGKSPHPGHEEVAQSLVKNPGQWARFPFEAVGLTVGPELPFEKACQRVRAVIAQARGPYKKHVGLNRRVDKFFTRADKKNQELYIKYGYKEEK